MEVDELGAKNSGQVYSGSRAGLSATSPRGSDRPGREIIAARALGKYF
ncbi:MAG: hypothetical protein JXR70_01770 [Spirochaetales bacterium]|nr:hypothetical protein [Spirochaetales bacterium]